MITENLYPTYSRFYVGYTNNQYQDEVTYDWNSEYSGETVNDMSAYWLGWISPDNLPLQYRLSAIYVDAETGEYCFDDITDESNFPCGYVHIANNTAGNLTTMKYTIDGVDDYRTANRARLLNNVHPEFSGMMRNYNESTQFTLSAYYILFDGGGNIILPINWNGYLPQVPIFNDSTTNQIIEAYNFLFEGATRQITISYSGVDYKFTITSDDLADGTVALWDDTNTVQVRLFLYSVKFGQGGSMNNTTQTNLRTSWCCQVTGNYDTHSVTKIACGSAVSTAGLNIYSMSQYTKTNPGYGMAGYAQNVKFPAEIVSAIRTGSEKYHWIKNMLAYHLSSDVMFLPFYPMDSIRKMFSLFYRVSLTGMNGYVKNFTYATDVTSSNEFLARLKTGNLSDTAFKNGLREWQYTDFQADDFDEDDIPPYSPTPPPGDDDDPGSDEPVETPLITGDDQDLQTDRTLGTCTNFITMYVITPPMMSIFGRTLWTSIADYDPQDPTTLEIFKNFFAVLSEEVAGTLDIGAILNFVVSVRQYPFNVAGLSIVTPSGDSIRIGTGKLPISLGTGANVQRLTSSIGILDCGSLTIGDYKDFKLYNDFRDYLNTSVSAFLPYCGTVELNPIEVIHNTLHCYYAIDFYTGECTAYITCTDGTHKWISAIKNGNIGVLIPVTATNSGQVSARHISDNAKDSSLITSAVGNMAGAIGNFATGNVMGGVSSILGLAQIGAAQKQLDAERQGRSAVMAPSLSGGSGAASFYQPSCASVLVRRGTYARAKIQNYPQTCAYPSTTSGTLSSFHGYTECYNVDVTGLNCTEEERAAVKTILETGCYL